MPERRAAARATAEQVAAARERRRTALHPRDPRNAPTVDERNERLADRIVSAPSEPPRSQQFERFYREHNRGYNGETMGLHWASGPDPFHRDAASLTMIRDLDHHYALQNPDINEGDYDSVDGHKQGVLISSEQATPWKIDTLYSTKGSHSAVAQLLGMAGEQSLRTTGRLPKASRDLSVHSSRLVRGLADRGIIDAPSNELRNSIDWEDGAASALSAVRYVEKDHNAGRESVTEVPSEEAAQGGQMLRQMLRGAKHSPVERWTPETLTESAPLVNARTKAGRFTEFEHHAQLQERADRKPDSTPRQEGLF